MAGATHGIRIAFNSQAFNPSPTWVRVDGGVGLSPFASASTASYSIDRGRSYQLDATQTGTATINLYDTTGMFDETNPNGPFFGEIGPMRQVSIQIQNPVDGLFYNLFTGFTEKWDYTYPVTPSNVLTNAAVSCVDGFEPLSRAMLPPDPSGTTTFAPINGEGAVAARILAVLAYFSQTPYGGSGYPTDPAAIYSGNVNILSAVYNGQTSLLTAILDAADAESGGIANNVFMGKDGNLNFRGRATRFTPENFENVGPPTLAKPITFWKCGDFNAAESMTNVAPIHDIEWGPDQENLVNAAQVYPGGTFTQQQINGQLVTNNTSVLKYGPRALSVPNLYTAGSPTITGNPFLNPPGLSALQETALYGQAYVDNLSYPFPHISTLSFTTPPPEQKNWAAWWNLVCGVEIGDVITVYTTNPGGGGFSTGGDGFTTDQFFVEGIHYQVTPGGADHNGVQIPQVTMSLDVSPRAWSSFFNGYQWYPGPIPDGVTAVPIGGYGGDGQVLNASNDFNAPSGAFSPSTTGQTINIQEGAFSQTFTVTYVSPIELTLNANWTGGTTATATWNLASAPPPIPGGRSFTGGFWTRPSSEAVSSSSSGWIANMITFGITDLFVNTGAFAPAWIPVTIGTTAGYVYGTVTSGSGAFTLNNVPLNPSMVTPHAFNSLDTDNEIVITDTIAGISYEVGFLPGLQSGPSWNAGAAAGGTRPFPLSQDGWVNQQGAGNGISCMAAGSSHLGGLIFEDELTNGLIAHALICSMDNGAIRGPSNSPVYPGGLIDPGAYTSPATRSDGSASSSSLPMGSRIRLKASANIATLSGGNATWATILTALQTYGAILADSSGGSAITFYAANICSPSSPTYPSALSSGLSGVISSLEIAVPAPNPIYSS